MCAKRGYVGPKMCDANSRIVRQADLLARFFIYFLHFTLLKSMRAHLPSAILLQKHTFSPHNPSKAQDFADIAFLSSLLYNY